MQSRIIFSLVALLFAVTLGESVSFAQGAKAPQPRQDPPKRVFHRMPTLRAPTNGRIIEAAPDDALSAFAQQQERLNPTSRCLNVRRIQKADVLDDQTIRMMVSNAQAFDMKLRGRCYNLSFDKSFYYQPGPTEQLCAGQDAIVTRSGYHCMIDSIDARKIQ